MNKIGCEYKKTYILDENCSCNCSLFHRKGSSFFILFDAQQKLKLDLLNFIYQGICVLLNLPQVYQSDSGFDWILSDPRLR